MKDLYSKNKNKDYDNDNDENTTRNERYEIRPALILLWTIMHIWVSTLHENLQKEQQQQQEQT